MTQAARAECNLTKFSFTEDEEFERWVIVQGKG
jgi:hypothetical protein